MLVHLKTAETFQMYFQKLQTYHINIYKCYGKIKSFSHGSIKIPLKSKIMTGVAIISLSGIFGKQYIFRFNKLNVLVK